jgi:hypothetical protein
MKRKIILLGCLLTLCHAWVGGKTLNKGITQTIQKNIQNISIGAYSFCVPELASVLQYDTSVVTALCKKTSKRFDYLKSDYSEDIYLSELLLVQLLRDSLSFYYSIHKETVVKTLLDSLEKVPISKVQKNKYYLFFKSFTDESGVGALKIETLLLTQDLNMLFEYIENNEQAKERFVRWISEEIEVWCPSIGTDNTIWDNRIVQCLYNRLCSVNRPLAQQAVTKMKQWFGNEW